MIQRVGASLEGARWTTRRHRADLAVALRIVVHRDVRADVEVQLPVPVVIYKGSASVKHSRFESAHARFVGHIGERPVAIVVVENVFSELRHKQIWKAIVVVVSPNAAEPESRSGHSSFVGHVRKRAVAIVVIKRIANIDSTSIPVARIHKVDVGPSIAVIIRHANARPELLQVDGHALVSLEMLKFDSRFVRDIREPHLALRLRLRKRRGHARERSGKPRRSDTTNHRQGRSHFPLAADRKMASITFIFPSASSSGTGTSVFSRIARENASP